MAKQEQALHTLGSWHTERDADAIYLQGTLRQMTVVANLKH
jgi:hypothetical protein